MASSGNARSRFADLTEPPWYRWKPTFQGRDMTDPAERCIRFIETYCRSNKGEGHGKPIRLAEFQKRWIRTVLKDDVQQAALQAPRGQGKSTLLAAMALWATFDRSPTGAPQVPICATTLKQARRSVYNVALAMRKAEPEMANRSIVFAGAGDERIEVGYNDGECFPIANDVDGLQGLDPSLAIMDEIGFQHLDSWTAMVLASGKRSRSLVVGIGTPGVDRSKSALWHLREIHLNGGAEGFSFTELSAPDDCDYRDEASWLIANPAIVEGFLQIKALRTLVKTLPESEFRMFRLGQWVEGTDCWLGVDGRKVWRDLTSNYQLKPGADTWAGVDIGLSQDTTAVVLGQWNGNVLHTTAKIWQPKPDGSLDATAVEKYIRDMAALYNLVEIAYDPRLFERSANDLADEGYPMVVFYQSVERMVPACGDLYKAIKRGEVSHDGADDYERQILNAMPTFTDTGFRLTKRRSRGRIDSAVALAMCHARAQERQLPALICA